MNLLLQVPALVVRPIVLACAVQRVNTSVITLLWDSGAFLALLCDNDNINIFKSYKYGKQ